MTREEHNALLGALLQEGVTQADIATIVNQLRSDYGGMIDTAEQLTNELNRAKEESTKYAKLNNELYLQIGVGKPPAMDNEEESHDEPPAKRSFEELDF